MRKSPTSTLTLLLSALIIAPTLCEPIRAQTSSIKENYVTVERLRVRYAESGGGQAVVMIHGKPGVLKTLNLAPSRRCLPIIA